MSYDFDLSPLLFTPHSSVCISYALHYTIRYSLLDQVLMIPSMLSAFIQLFIYYITNEFNKCLQPPESESEFQLTFARISEF